MEKHQSKVYRRALSEGAAEVSYCRVMLLGPAGVGKTCLKRGLMGMPFDPLTNSTIVADIHSVRPMSREWITQYCYSKEWSEVTEKDEIMELAQLIVLAGADENLLSPRIHPGTTTSDPLSELLTAVSSSFSLKELQELMESNIVQQALIEAQQLQKCTLNDIKCHPFFHLWDCGGQPVFLEVLPLFLTSRTLFLILFNSSINLEQPWESAFYNEDGKRYHEEKVNMSTLQMMERWIAMIYSHLLKKDEHGVDPGYPRVIPIGTRKDKLIKSGGDPLEVMKVIGDSFHGKDYTQVVEEPMIIDNTTSGGGNYADEDVGYEVVRGKVLDMAMSKLRRVDTPIAWILFRKLLQLLSETSPNANIISLQEVCAIASIAKVKPDEVEVVLQFYHDLGIFLYYPSIEGLKEKVILDPKWFVECLGKVLSLNLKDEKYEDRNEWRLFRSKGIIVERLLHKTCQGIEPKEFIELLSHFQLAVEVTETTRYAEIRPKKQFFIPAILLYRPVQPTLSSPMESVIKVAPLHVTFDSGFVVPGFFTRLSVTMLNESTDPEIPFKLELYFGEDDDNSEIYHDRMVYEMSTQSFQPVAPLFVTVTEENNCIVIDVNSYSKFGQTITGIQTTCLSLKSHVTTCSESVSQCLQSVHSNISKSVSLPRVKVVCQAEECQGQRIHYLRQPSHEELSIDDCMVTCEKNRRKPRRMTIEEAYWFKVQFISYNSESIVKSANEVYSLEDVMPSYNQDTVTKTDHSLNLSTVPMQTDHVDDTDIGATAIRTEQERVVDDPAATSDDRVTAPPPSVEEVFSLLEDKANNWYDIGRVLKVYYGRRDELRKDNSLSAESKLEIVLYEWNESQHSPVSWNDIKAIFESLKYNRLAAEVDKKYISLN